MPRLAAVVALGLLVTAWAGQRRAFAAPAGPAPAPLPPGSADRGLGLKQFGLATLGVAATAGVGLTLTWLTDDQEAKAFGGSLFVAPTVAGLVVCHVGTWSVLYTGRCGAAVAGAYIGALGGVLSGALLGLGACSSGSTDPSHPDSGPSGGDCETTPLVGAAVGYLLGTALGALVGWNISRQPKEPANAYADGAAAAAPDDGARDVVLGPRAAPPPMRPDGAPSPRQVVFPLFATAF